MTRGKYIVIEGNDGTGKSTQVEQLAIHLNTVGIPSQQIHEPAGNPIADAIRSVIKNGELDRDAETNLLLFTAARHELWKEARAALESGTWILSARNYLSTMAYQGYGEGLDLDTISDITRQFTDELYMQPDRMIVLSLPDQAREERIRQRGVLEQPDTFEARAQDFQDKVNMGYRSIADEYSLPVIDASVSIDTIHRQIRELLNI